MATTEGRPVQESTTDQSRGEEDQTQGAAKILRLISDPTRLRILKLLAEGDRSSTELSSMLGQTQPTISHHLALLRHHLKDVIEGQKHDDVLKIIRSKRERYE
jgi:DNA-binding transcriptional ArsR family regulator